MQKPSPRFQFPTNPISHSALASHWPIRHFAHSDGRSRCMRQIAANRIRHPGIMGGAAPRCDFNRTHRISLHSSCQRSLLSLKQLLHETVVPPRRIAWLRAFGTPPDWQPRSASCRPRLFDHSSKDVLGTNMRSHVPHFKPQILCCEFT